MISVVGMAAGERDAARAEDAAADEIWASVFSGLIVTLSCCSLMELEGIGDAEDVGADNEEKSFSLGRELLILELAGLLTEDPRFVVLLVLLPLTMVPLLVLLDLDDLELLSRCEDDEDDDDDDGSLSWLLFVLDTLFTFLLYLSLSLLLLLEEDELGFTVVPPGTLLLEVPELMLAIPADAVLPVGLTMLLLLLLPLPLLIMADDDDVAIELVDPFEAPDDFLCFDDDDAEEEVLPCSPGNRLLDFMLPAVVLPLVILLPLGCGCNEGGSSSFSGDEGPSLEFVS